MRQCTKAKNESRKLKFIWTKNMKKESEEMRALLVIDVMTAYLTIIMGAILSGGGVKKILGFLSWGSHLMRNNDAKKSYDWPNDLF